MSDLHHGENRAADAVVVAGTGLDRSVLLIQRKDCGQWAIPGGMVDPGETGIEAAGRELHEETGVDLDGLEPTILGRVHVNDPRETADAWITSTVVLYTVRAAIPAAGGDDAADAGWFPCGSMPALETAISGRGELYEAHRPLLTLALDHLDQDDRCGGHA